MRPILIVQTGDAPEAISSRHGNYDAMFLRMGGLDPAATVTVRVFCGAPPEDPGRYRGCIVTGSDAMVTDHETWSEDTAEWLRAARGKNLPLFGVCYGHQLLAYALGGAVDCVPGGQEAGTLAVTLEDAGARDPLLKGFPPRFPVNLAHSQMVVETPPGAWTVAGSARDRRQILVYGALAYSVQFHPEFDSGVMRDYLDLAARSDPRREREFLALRNAVSETPLAVLMLRRFVAALPPK